MWPCGTCKIAWFYKFLVPFPLDFHIFSFILGSSWGNARWSIQVKTHRSCWSMAIDLKYPCLRVPRRVPKCQKQPAIWVVKIWGPQSLNIRIEPVWRAKKPMKKGLGNLVACQPSILCGLLHLVVFVHPERQNSMRRNLWYHMWDRFTSYLVACQHFDSFPTRNQGMFTLQFCEHEKVQSLNAKQQM